MSILDFVSWINVLFHNDFDLQQSSIHGSDWICIFVLTSMWFFRPFLFRRIHDARYDRLLNPELDARLHSFATFVAPPVHWKRQALVGYVTFLGFYLFDAAFLCGVFSWIFFLYSLSCMAYTGDLGLVPFPTVFFDGASILVRPMSPILWSFYSLLYKDCAWKFYSLIGYCPCVLFERLVESYYRIVVILINFYDSWLFYDNFVSHLGFFSSQILLVSQPLNKIQTFAVATTVCSYLQNSSSAAFANRLKSVSAQGVRYLSELVLASRSGIQGQSISHEPGFLITGQTDKNYFVQDPTEVLAKVGNIFDGVLPGLSRHTAAIARLLKTGEVHSKLFSAVSFCVKEVIWLCRTGSRNADDRFDYLYPRIAGLRRLIIRILSHGIVKVQKGKKVFDSLKNSIELFDLLLSDLGSVSNENPISAPLKHHRDLSRKWNTEIKQLNPVFNHSRQKPTASYFHGPSRMGKTGLLAESIAILVKDADPDHTQAFVKSSDMVSFGVKTDHQDQYNGQHTLVIDDPCAVEISTTEMQNPLREWMQMIDTCPLPMSMAALNLKGTLFESRNIVITANFKLDKRLWKDQDAIENRLMEWGILPCFMFLRRNSEYNSRVDVRHELLEASGEIPEFLHAVFQDHQTEICELVSLLLRKKIEPEACLNDLHKVWSNMFDDGQNLMDFYFEFKPNETAIPTFDSLEALIGNDKPLKTSPQQIQACRRIVELVFPDPVAAARQTLRLYRYCPNVTGVIAVHDALLPQERFVGGDVYMQVLLADFAMHSKSYHAGKVQEVETGITEADIEAIAFEARRLAEKPDEIISSDFSVWFSRIKEFIEPLKHDSMITRRMLNFVAIATGCILVGVGICYRLSKNRSNGNSLELIHNLLQEEGCPGVPLGQSHTEALKQHKRSRAFGIRKGERIYAQSLTFLHVSKRSVPPEVETRKDISDLGLPKVGTQANMETRSALLEKSMVNLISPFSKKTVGYGLGIKKKQLLTIGHVWHGLTNGVTVSTKSGELVLSPEEVAQCSVRQLDEDLVLVWIEKADDFKDITSRFPNLREIKESLPLCSAQILVKRVDGQTIPVVFIHTIPSGVRYEERVITYDCGGRPKNLSKYIVAPYTNRAGFCGSPIVVVDGPLVSKIVAMHVAGSDDRSFSVVLYRELFDTEAEPIKGQSLNEFYVGPSPYRLSFLRNSQMRKAFSATKAHEHGFVNAKIAPKLFIQDGKDPLLPKLDHFSKLDAKFDYEALHLAQDDLKSIFSDERETLSHEDAFFGYGDYLSAIDYGTGLGPKLKSHDIKYKGDKGRSAYGPFRKDGKVQYGQFWPEFCEDLDQMVCELQDGPIPMYFEACPKSNEPLLPEKHPRCFFVGDFANLILSRKLFGTFLSKIAEERITNGIAIGVNPHGSDWRLLINRLNTFPGGEFMDSDISKMEFRMYFPDIVDSLIEIIMSAFPDHVQDLRRENGKMYPPMDVNAVRRNFLKSIFQPYIIFEGGLYHGMNFNPSGHPLTAALNSLVLLLWKRYTFYSLRNRVSNLTMERYSSCVREIVMGDDSVEAVSPLCEWYNNETICAFLAEYDIKITPADKGTVWVKKHSLTDCVFLQRDFSMIHGRPRALLSKSSIEVMLFWRRSKKDSLENRQNLMDSCLYEASLHGSDYFNKVRKVYVDTVKWKKLQASLQIPTYLDCRRRFEAHWINRD